MKKKNQNTLKEERSGRAENGGCQRVREEEMGRYYSKDAKFWLYKSNKS